MNYSAIKYYDIANGPGVRTSLFVSGCTLRCKGCFNYTAWDFNSGQPFTKETEEEILESLRSEHVSGLTILGGEPMELQNRQALLPFIKRVREEFPKLSIWVYSGYTWETDHLDRMQKEWPETRELLSLLDVIVDGKFDIDQYSLMLKFRGSKNQRIIDVQKSLATGETVLVPEY